jgi:hypothetical protein
MLLYRHPNAGRNRDIKVTSMSFENVAQLKYWETMGTNQNLILGEVKRRMNGNDDNASYCRI